MCSQQSSFICHVQHQLFVISLYANRHFSEILLFTFDCYRLKKKETAVKTLFFKMFFDICSICFSPILMETIYSGELISRIQRQIFIAFFLLLITTMFTNLCHHALKQTNIDLDYMRNKCAISSQASFATFNISFFSLACTLIDTSMKNYSLLLTAIG